MRKPPDRAWRNSLAICGAGLAGFAYFHGIRNEFFVTVLHIAMSAFYFHLALCAHDGVKAYPILQRRR